jgi:hypothetical protein
MTQLVSAPQKVDLYRERSAFFRAARTPELVDLPEAGFLVVSGEGSPESQAFQDAIGALYSVAYTLKMTGKSDGNDFKVPTFEGVWWIFSDGAELPRERWRWQLLMMVPDFVSEGSVEAAKEELKARKKELKAPLRFDRIRQGLCVQMLHVGPYEAEAGSIEMMTVFINELGLKQRGPLHEVYLGDPRRSKPEALKTLLRQPVEPAVAGS